VVNDERSRLLAVGGEFTTTALRARRWRGVLGVGSNFQRADPGVPGRSGCVAVLYTNVQYLSSGMFEPGGFFSAENNGS